MTHEQLLAFLPFILLAAASIVVILLIAFRLSHTVIQVTGFLMMCMVIFAMWYVRDVLPQSIMPSYKWLFEMKINREFFEAEANGRSCFSG